MRSKLKNSKPTKYQLHKHAVRGMFAKIYSRRVRVRLLGVRVEGFCPDGERFEIFGYKVRNRERMLSECIDDVRNRFGKYSIRPGRALVRIVRKVS